MAEREPAGSVYTVINLPRTWPASGCSVGKAIGGGTVINVTVRPDRRIEVGIRNSIDGWSLHRLTQPLDLNGNTTLRTLIGWGNSDDPNDPPSPDGVLVCVNSTTPLENGDVVRQLDAPKQVELFPGSALEHPDRFTACAGAMNHRRANYLPSPPRPGRRSLTHAEAKQALRESAEVLSEAVAMIRSGRSAFLRTLRSELRSLVYESFDKNDTARAVPRLKLYNPLLFRVATAMEVPLPVFAIPPQDWGNLPVPTVQFSYSPPLLVQRRGHVLMDLRDWLEQVMFKTALAPSGAARVTDAIAHAASTMGASHDDPDVHEYIDEIDSLVAADVSAFTSLLCATAVTVADLAASLAAVA